MTTHSQKMTIGKFRLIAVMLSLILVCAGVSKTFADNPHFTSIDYPAAFLTAVNDVNVNGDVVGVYRLVAGGPQHGFLLSEGVFTSIDYPGAINTRALGINDAGDIVGAYTISGSYEKGFLMRGGSFVTLTSPFPHTWAPWGIDNDGNMTGAFRDPTPTPKIKGFFWNGGATFTAFEAPFAGTTQTQTHGINERGETVGCFFDAAGMHSLRILSDGSYVNEDFPGSISSMHYRISPSSIMVGYYVDTDEVSHAYLMKKGEYESFDFPKAIYTDARGIAEVGKLGRWGMRQLLIVGSYLDGDGVQRGYLFTRQIGVGNYDKF